MSVFSKEGLPCPIVPCVKVDANEVRILNSYLNKLEKPNFMGRI